MACLAGGRPGRDEFRRRRGGGPDGWVAGVAEERNGGAEGPGRVRDLLQRRGRRSPVAGEEVRHLQELVSWELFVSLVQEQ